jgi:hypothetical protein
MGSAPSSGYAGASRDTAPCPVTESFTIRLWIGRGCGFYKQPAWTGGIWVPETYVWGASPADCDRYAELPIYGVPEQTERLQWAFEEIIRSHGWRFDLAIKGRPHPGITVPGALQILTEPDTWSREEIFKARNSTIFTKTHDWCYDAFFQEPQINFRSRFYGDFSKGEERCKKTS